jgi:hypothetical protein
MGPVACKVRICVIELTGNIRINLRIRCVLATTFTMEKQYVLHIFSVCVCVA